MLSHGIVIVRASRRDAHRDRYLLRMHLLFKRYCVISGLEYLPVSLTAPVVLFTEIGISSRSIVPISAHLATPRMKLMSNMDVAHWMLFIASGEEYMTIE